MRNVSALDLTRGCTLPMGMVGGTNDRSYYSDMLTRIKNAVRIRILRLTDCVKWISLRSRRMFIASATSKFALAEKLSSASAWRAVEHAIDTVPAYRKYLDENNWTDSKSKSFEDRIASLPVTDKKIYIDKFSTPDRCVDGAIPLEKTELDESSGSSGTPYNWVRSDKELHEVHLTLSNFADYLIGSKLVTINAFSMGAWSTGVNVARALARNGLVKSPGPDLEKCLGTLQFMGPDHVYAITGYPPFLRELLDFGDENGFDWTPYKLFGFVGGEGMSEQLRERLESRFIRVYSAYGASDLDIGVAAETPISVWIRKHAGSDRNVQRAIFGDDPRVPMLFQYNPLDYYVETNSDNELIITVSRLCMLSPRIRYNIHDAGGELNFGEMLSRLNSLGLDPLADLDLPHQRVFRMPFLWVYGRADSTISFMGANIYPEDVEQALFVDNAEAENIIGFCLELKTLEGGVDVAPYVHVELNKSPRSGVKLKKMLSDNVRTRLAENSRDYKAALAESNQAGTVIVELHAKGTGPFAENSKRIKRKYILQ